MKDTALIEKIRSLFAEITPKTRSETVKRVIQDLSRSLNLIKADEGSSLYKKYAIDLHQLFASEVAFQKMKNASATILSDGFFKSFEILKKDILKALENHSK